MTWWCSECSGCLRLRLIGNAASCSRGKLNELLHATCKHYLLPTRLFALVFMTATCKKPFLCPQIFTLLLHKVVNGREEFKRFTPRCFHHGAWDFVVKRLALHLYFSACCSRMFPLTSALANDVTSQQAQKHQRLLTLVCLWIGGIWLMDRRRLSAKANNKSHSNK